VWEGVFVSICGFSHDTATYTHMHTHNYTYIHTSQSRYQFTYSVVVHGIRGRGLGHHEVTSWSAPAPTCIQFLMLFSCRLTKENEYIPAPYPSLHTTFQQSPCMDLRELNQAKSQVVNAQSCIHVRCHTTV